jgi:type IV pilus assembly protein PilW
MKQLRRHPRARQAGFNLIELMVGMTLSLIVVGAAFGIYISNQQLYRTNQHLVTIQDSVRISFEMMAREVRQAGGTPCGPQAVSNVLNERNARWFTTWREGGLIAYPSGQTIGDIPIGTNAGERRPDTEALQVMSANIAASHTVLNHDPAAQTLTLQPGATIRPNSLVLMCDGESAVMFRVATVVGDTATYTVSTAPDSNCTGDFGPFVSCASGDSKTFPAGSLISPVTASVWFIRNGARGQPVLARATADSVEEIADNIDSIRTSFLTVNTNGSLASDWVQPNAIADWTTTRVAAARVELAVQVADANASSPSPRRTLTFVANLRNRSN